MGIKMANSPNAIGAQIVMMAIGEWWYSGLPNDHKNRAIPKQTYIDVFF